MTQHEKILSLLSNGEWICTNSFYASYIADPRTRIVELKKKGYLLEWRWCQTHEHRKSKEWRLLAEPQEKPYTSPNAQICDLRPSNPEKRYIDSLAPQTLQEVLFNFSGFNYRH